MVDANRLAVFGFRIGWRFVGLGAFCPARLDGYAHCAHGIATPEQHPTEAPCVGCFVEATQAIGEFARVEECVIGVGCTDVVLLRKGCDSVFGDAVFVQIALNSPAAAARGAQALFDKVGRKRMIIDKACLAEACTDRADGCGVVCFLAQAIGEFAEAPWPDFEQSQGRLFGPVVGIAGDEAVDVLLVKMLAHEDAFVSQGVERYADGEFAIDGNRHPLTLAHLCPDSGDRARLRDGVILLRRMHRRLLQLGRPWRRPWCHGPSRGL